MIIIFYITFQYRQGNSLGDKQYSQVKGARPELPDTNQPECKDVGYPYPEPLADAGADADTPMPLFQK
jgi:hypothetical protein